MSGGGVNFSQLQHFTWHAARLGREGRNCMESGGQKGQHWKASGAHLPLTARSHSISFTHKLFQLNSSRLVHQLPAELKEQGYPAPIPPLPPMIATSAPLHYLTSYTQLTVRLRKSPNKKICMSLKVCRLNKQLVTQLHAATAISDWNAMTKSYYLLPLNAVVLLGFLLKFCFCYVNRRVWHFNCKRQRLAKLLSFAKESKHRKSLWLFLKWAHR